MNAKDPELVEKFVQLRALGWSFARIAEALDISKPTLIQWNRIHQQRIRNLRAIELEKMSEQLGLANHQFLEHIADDLRRIHLEISQRPLDDLPTYRLYAVAASLRAEANRLNPPLAFENDLDPVSLALLADMVARFKVPLHQLLPNGQSDSAQSADIQTLPGKV